jgi:signal peptidase I
LKNKLRLICKVIIIYLSVCLFLIILPVLNPVFKTFSLVFIRGQSMYPAIKDGDMVISRPFNASKDKLTVDMIVEFQDEDKTDDRKAFHRIIGFAGDHVIMRGDNNIEFGVHFSDGKIPYENIYSVYLFKIPLHYLGIGKINSILHLFNNYYVQEKKSCLPAHYIIIFFLSLLLFLLVIKRELRKEKA